MSGVSCLNGVLRGNMVEDYCWCECSDGWTGKLCETKMIDINKIDKKKFLHTNEKGVEIEECGKGMHLTNSI